MFKLVLNKLLILSIKKLLYLNIPNSKILKITDIISHNFFYLRLFESTLSPNI